MIDEQEVRELLRTKPNGNLHHRESQVLEFKEQFNFAGLADYYRDFAAFANNRGGFLIHGVSDAPRRLVGLNASAADQFDKLDPEEVTGHLLNIYSPQIVWEHDVVEYDDKAFGVFKVYEASIKPVIAKLDQGRDKQIENGSIYYRYGGRTQKVQYAELESIINKRIKQINDNWIDLAGKIGAAGPENAAILDTEKSLISKKNSQILVLDDNLASKLKFIKEGSFNEKSGAPALKLVGDVSPIDQVEVVRTVKERLLHLYPHTATDLANSVKARYPETSQNKVWDVIRETDMKNDSDYSVYNWRNRAHEELFNETGVVPPATPSLYNDRAIEVVEKLLRESNDDN
ncbi:ATP-binding protein [Granulosicoccus sp.]|nr:ATP-binding protein [Granulosicoccus sp.]